MTGARQVALVTGAASGIGRATSLELAATGMSVVVVDLDEHGGESVADLIRSTGGAAEFRRCDVGAPDDLVETFGAVVADHGRVDVVHNNAGIIPGGGGWLGGDLDRVVTTVDVNLTGVVVGTRLAVAAMGDRGGVVVNTASTTGIDLLPDEPVYAATKAAVIHFTRSCGALAASHGVRVNAVVPAGVDTPFLRKTGDGETPASWLAARLPELDLLSPEVVAEAVVRLVGDPTLAGHVEVIRPGPT